MKILMIDDNQRLAERVRETLGKVYVIDIALDGETGLSQAADVEYDAIILDLGLPDISGQEVCRQLRIQGQVAPIIVLTATDNVSSRVQMLDMGADDYMAKPFSSAELNARIAALSRRRRKQVTSEVMLVKDLELDVLRREVKRSGIRIPLRRKEFDILECLISNKGRAVSREMIINHAWVDGTDGWNNTVDVHIKHIRDKVDKPFPTKLIRTAYGIGYMIDDSD